MLPCNGTCNNSVNQRRTENIMAKRKSTKGQTTIYKAYTTNKTFVTQTTHVSQKCCLATVPATTNTDNKPMITKYCCKLHSTRRRVTFSDGVLICLSS
jgi:hypothetical protein